MHGLRRWRWRGRASGSASLQAWVSRDWMRYRRNLRPRGFRRACELLLEEHGRHEAARPRWPRGLSQSGTVAVGLPPRLARRRPVCHSHCHCRRQRPTHLSSNFPSPLPHHPQLQPPPCVSPANRTRTAGHSGAQCVAQISPGIRKLTSAAPKKKAQKMALADFFETSRFHPSGSADYLQRAVARGPTRWSRSPPRVCLLCARGPSPGTWNRNIGLGN